jgi:glycopeptide antibiotics resistance protein
VDIRFSVSQVVLVAPATVAAVTALVLARKRGWAVGNIVLLLATIAYATGVLAVTIFPIDANIGKYASTNPWYTAVNPIPVITIDAPTFLLNIVMMVPLGMLLPLLSARAQSVRPIALVSLLVSGAIEVTQMLLKVTLDSGRTADVNDLIANVLGAVLGFLAVVAVARLAPARTLLGAVALPGTPFATALPVDEPTTAWRG